MKSLKLTCLSMLAAVVLAGCQQGSGTTSSATGNSSTGTATLSWQAPTTYTNGQALTDLAGYRIYYGTSVNDLGRTIRLTSVGLQTYVIDNLTTGTWYFGISAITNSGVESGLSDIVSKTIG